MSDPLPEPQGPFYTDEQMNTLPQELRQTLLVRMLHRADVESPEELLEQVKREAGSLDFSDSRKTESVRAMNAAIQSLCESMYVIDGPHAGERHRMNGIDTRLSKQEADGNLTFHRYESAHSSDGQICLKYVGPFAERTATAA